MRTRRLLVMSMTTALLAGVARPAPAQELTWKNGLTFYLDNTEFFNPYRTGETLLGGQVLSYLSAALGPRTEIVAGFHGNHQSGDARFLVRSSRSSASATAPTIRSASSARWSPRIATATSSRSRVRCWTSRGRSSTACSGGSSIRRVAARSFSTGSGSTRRAGGRYSTTGCCSTPIPMHWLRLELQGHGLHHGGQLYTAGEPVANNQVLALGGQLHAVLPLVGSSSLRVFQLLSHGDVDSLPGRPARPRARDVHPRGDHAGQLARAVRHPVVGPGLPVQRGRRQLQLAGIRPRFLPLLPQVPGDRPRRAHPDRVGAHARHRVPLPPDRRPQEHSDRDLALGVLLPADGARAVQHAARGRPTPGRCAGAALSRAARRYWTGQRAPLPTPWRARSGQYGSRSSSRASSTRSACPSATIASACSGVGDQADRAGRHGRLAPDPLARTAPDSPGRPGSARRARVPPDEQSTRSTPSSASRRASATDCSTSQPPSAQSVAEIRTNSGSSPGHARAPRSATSSSSRMRLSNEPPYSSVAAVGERREELVQQVAVRRVDLDHLEAGGQRRRAAAAKAATTPAISAAVQRSGTGSPARKGSRSGATVASRPRLGRPARRPPTAARCSPCGRRARAGCRRAAPLLADELGDARAAARRARRFQMPRSPRRDPALGRHGGRFGHDQRRAADGAAAEVDQVPVVGEAVASLEYWHMGLTTTRLCSSSERSVSGENSGGGTVTRKSAPGPRLAVKEGEGPSDGRGGPGIALWRPVGPRTLSRHTPRTGGLMAGKRLAILTLAVLAGCGGDRGAQHGGRQPEPRLATAPGRFVGHLERPGRGHAGDPEAGPPSRPRSRRRSRGPRPSPRPSPPPRRARWPPVRRSPRRWTGRSPRRPTSRAPRSPARSPAT